MSSINAVYNFDKLGRLTNVTWSDASMATFTYDTAGNRSTVVEVPAVIPPLPPTPMASGFADRIAGDFKNTPMMVLLSGGEIMGWGDNTTGVLANGIQTATFNLPQLLLFDPNTTVPPSTATIVSWVYTNANLYVTYSNGWVYSAGMNTYGQLGKGDLVARPYLSRIEYFVTNSISIVKVWAGGGYSTTDGAGCAYFLGSNYTMYGCGLNTAGNLGNALTPTTNVSTPAPCAGINNTPTSHVVDMAVVIVDTSVSAYMLLSDGTLMVAGYNGQGQLAINSTVSQSGTFVSALTISGNVSNAASISANSGSSTAGNALFVDTAGSVWTVGYATHGELGLGSVTEEKIFTQVTALSGITIAKAELGGGLYGFGYALDTSNKLYTWGYNGQNNLFKNSVVTPQSTPALVPATNLPPGQTIAKVFFSKGEQGLSTTPQLILLSTAGNLAYAGADNGQLGISDPTGTFNYIATPQDLMDGTDKVVDLYVHGTGLTQRWFVLTANGNLYGCGQNADCVCTGGVSSAVTAANAQWQPIILG